MEFQIGDRVRVKNSKSLKIGYVIGFYEETILKKVNGDVIVFANKGDLKVQFVTDGPGTYQPFDPSQVEKRINVICVKKNG